MPPWPEWQVEYVGSSFLGKLLGFWLGFWISLPKRLFLIFRTGIENSKPYNRADAHLSRFDARAKVYRIAISTLLMLGFWRLATLKPFWLAFDESGHRIIVALLFLLTASWMMSVVWIYLSKVRKKG
jgi:ABC-type lipoprotein release transport system permease subunit